ncbi:hypothetical protein DFJ77DRAFT_463908 [Powellomyces hirtus]|nr:hypothetical protein DFJ77DRAFT_463908 [Powellomyces hirtus]
MKRIGGLTIPKPFNFHSTLRSIANDVSAPKSPFVPLAVKVKTFETQVPDRFRGTKNKMRNSVVPQSMPTSPWAGRVRMTRPRSPYLLTKMRTKTHHVPSHEETELAELAKIQPFKAKPVDRHILHSEPILPAVPRAPITVPESPHITKPRPAPARPPSPPRIPHARPVPTKVFEAPFEPQIHHRVITPVEYELPGDQISRKKKLEFEQRRREEEAREREQKQFHAQPLPFDDVPSQRQPHIEPRPITQPLPFTLETEVRGLFSQLALSSKLEREEAEDQERKKFKAQPIPLALDHPFFPAASNKPLTSTDPDFILNTDARAEERRAFDERRREREREEERVRERMRKEQEEREAEEIRQLRAAQVHRAQPPQYATRMKPVTIHPSNRKLTDPASPFIGTKRRTADQIKIDPFGAVKPKLGAETLSATSVAVAQQHPRQQFQFQVPQQPQQPQQQPQQQQTSPTTTTTTTTTTTHHHRLHPHPSYQRSPFDSPADAGSDHAEDHHHELGEHFRYKGGGGAELQKRLYEVAERIERGERVDE